MSGTSFRELQNPHLVRLRTFALKSWVCFLEVTLPMMLCLPPVDKWMKRTKMDFLGIPTCVGFGLHADIYRCVYEFV